jgi:hypothetical protein
MQIHLHQEIILRKSVVHTKKKAIRKKIQKKDAAVIIVSA